MPRKDPRIDKHIEKAAPFAQPILRHFRKLVHQSCPQVEETLKWGMPHFLHNGKILCGMAGFKAHCAVWFWKGAEVLGGESARVGMGNFGKITSLKDLPSAATLKSYIKRAAKLNESEQKPKRAIKTRKPPPRTPPDFMRALRANKKAFKTYEAFSPSMRREYVDWIVEAKTEETRERRLETAVDWIAEGKKRNWKYEKC